MLDPDRDRLSWVLAQIEAELQRRGGALLLSTARELARDHLERHHPWNGHGAEPLARMRARLEVLSDLLPP
ncbi:hypothetical protein [Pseudonocardia endophytica]|uniref:Uncharacterized protein n=1 Tax=Pseudonocardia endophytica TaxID=401976 RepID=A0A4R1HU58_PSEEN|nr:hypothetical protein [Pseudonocardia endophytica]TCK26224.1 hypothetical protein EV378_2053 [Pseudonocardia endophytica]